MRAALVIVALAACTRAPVDDCPPLGVGDLVVTEVKGDDDELAGPWIELTNASGASIDLAGLRIRFRRADGSSEIPVIVRRTVTVAAGGYVVLGKFTDGAGPAHVDYGFLDDFAGRWLAAAFIDVEACGVLVDRVEYSALPDSGTFALGVAPDHERNDLASSWCFDPNAPGTPGAANPERALLACP